MHRDFEIFKPAEALLDERLKPLELAVIRLDGSNFSRLTRQFAKPFSAEFETAMDAAAKAVKLSVLPNALITYAASDEISLVISDAVAELPYGRRIQKLVSLAAATASLAFLRALPETVGDPVFDGRVLQLKDASQLETYLSWRRLDCRKNATSMAAGHLYSHKELMGVSSSERGKLLTGTPFEVIPDGTFNGRLLVDGSMVPATRELAAELAQAASEKHSYSYGRKSV